MTQVMRQRPNGIREKNKKAHSKDKPKECVSKSSLPGARLVAFIALLLGTCCVLFACWRWMLWKRSASSMEDDRALLGRGNSLLSAGDLQRAAQVYQTCINAGGPSAMSCASNLASIFNTQRQDDKAEALYRKVLAAQPQNQAARFNLAMLLQDRGTMAAVKEATILYRTITRAEPKDFNAWANLGAALQTLNEQPISGIVKAYQRAIVLLETHIGDDEAAAARHAPVMAQLYHRHGALLSKVTEEQCSELLADKDVLLLQDDASPAKLVCLDNAINALRTVQELAPDSSAVEELELLLAKRSESANKASPSFVKALFDEEASTFNEKLASLNYTVPQQVAAEVERLVTDRGRAFASALDAGCGTGLVGPLIRRSIHGSLIGADLSQKSLDVAAKLKGEDGLPIYAKLYAGDLLSLKFEERPFELLLAADVLVYFGDLSAVISGFSQLLTGGGTIVFSCERLGGSGSDDIGWQLMSSGRFAHHRKYVEAVSTAQGLKLAAYREIVPRFEHGQEVPGHLFVFEATGM